MASIVTDGGDAQRRAGWRMLGSSTATIVVIAAMMTATIACVLFVADQQGRLSGLRDDARAMRMSRQAVMELDATVLQFLAHPGESPDRVDYGKKVSRLEAFGNERLPRTVRRGPDEVPAAAVLASLKAAWDDVVAHLGGGEADAARGIYDMRQVPRDMAALNLAFTETLDSFQARYTQTERAISLAIWTSLVGQLAAGLFSIVAFTLAARRGARESEARALAISTADATREQVTRLFEMTDMLQSASDLADANAVLKATVGELLPGMGGALYVFNNSRDRLALSTHWDTEKDALAETIGLQQCWALKRGKAHVNRTDTRKLCCEHHQGPDHALEIPMIARGEILGLLLFLAGGDDAEQRLRAASGVATAIADGMSLAIANLGLREKLRSQALRDPLTGLYNRRYMEDTLERVVRLADREKRDVSLLMIDLDHFKRLNDNHGHAKGDAVLRDVAAVIVRALRDSDVACRYGGEELLVILPHCGLAMAAAKAERLRASVEALSEPGGAQVTASFGVAAIPATSVNVRDLMAAADAALYQAKQEGRNRVVCAPLVGGPDAAAEKSFRAELDAAE